VADPARTGPRLYVSDDVDLVTLVGAYGATAGRTAAEMAVCPSPFGLFNLSGSGTTSLVSSLVRWAEGRTRRNSPSSEGWLSSSAW